MAAGALPAPARAKQLTLVACIAGSSIAFLDEFVVNVALPAIREDLGGGLAAQQWMTNAYLLALGSLLLVGGSLGDLFGERRVFAIGVAGFGLMSVLCAAAPTIEVLIAGRALQGAAAALLVPATLAVIVATFPEDERGKAIGTWTAWTGIATVVGPLVGGQLVDAGSWRWIFAINVPLVIATLVLIALAVPAGRAATDRPRVDLAGAALAAGVPLLLGFIAWERRSPAPMLPLGLFRRRNFAVGNLQTLLMYAGLAGMFFFLTIFLQQVAGYDALEAGVASLPTTGVLFFLSKRFGMLADRLGPRAFMAGGPLVSAVGLLLLLRIDASFDYLTELLPALLVFAVGLAMTVAPLTAAVLAGAEERNAGIASGTNTAVARVADLLGIAVIGVFLAAQFSSAIDDRARTLGPAARSALLEARERPLVRPATGGLSPRERREVSSAATDASVSGFHLGMGIAGGLFVLGGLVAAVGIRNPQRKVRAEDCPGGALVGRPSDDALCREGRL